MRIRLIAIMALVLVTALAAGCGTAVPDVKGMDVDRAAQTLVAAGFKLGSVERSSSATGHAGSVASQYPESGTRVAAGSVVNLTIIESPPIVVPSLIGMTREGATSALGIVGLKPGSVLETHSPTAPVGTVFAQDPAVGTTTTPGATVGFALSLGPKPVTGSSGTSSGGSSGGSTAPVKVKVPTVKGLTLGAAKAKILAAGLKYKNVLGPGDGMTDVGFAYKQFPAAGVTVTKGTYVTVYSWKGP